MIDERQQAMLDFERTYWTMDEPKEMLIRARFQCSEADYDDELRQLIQLDAAAAHDPLLVRRLRRTVHRRFADHANVDMSGGVS